MDITLYNTASRTKEAFSPIREGEVGMYTCGPTVYHYAHIGNLRSYVVADVLKRMFAFNGYTVRQVINITDVGHLVSDADEGEDKLEARARQTQRSVQDIADFYTEAFMDDIARLQVDTTNTQFPKATEHIDEQIKLIQTLEEKGYTYRTSDGVYFDTAQFPDYAAFGRLYVEGMQEGARIAPHPEKRNVTDFALWKFSPKEQSRMQEWESPWGVGFPGWHIECSAMAMHYLGEHFDVHTGGIDHIPVHHTNEIAQSRCATGAPFANYWMHNEFVQVAEGKMAKSDGNILTLQTLIDNGIDPLAYRYWLLAAHYRSPTTFTWEALQGAQQAYRRMVEHMQGMSDAGDGEPHAASLEECHRAVNDDLDTPRAIATLWGMLRDETLDNATKRATALAMDRLLGLGLDTAAEPTAIPDEVQALVDKREAARADRDWDRADALRAEIEAAGYEVRDTADGPQVRRI